MRDFTAQRFNVLLCSTIIETGIDIPTANTIVIHRADKFGLAQLHQLRGRVGRSHHQAYAYLLTPPEDALEQAGEEAARGDPDDGGARLGLLPRDARPRDPRRGRGAGRVAVGRDPGSRLLALRAHARARGARAEGGQGARARRRRRRRHRGQPARAGAAAGEPTAATCTSASRSTSAWPTPRRARQLDVLREELVDRFGELPEPARALLECHRVRIAARPLGVARIDATHEAVQLQFVKNPPLDGAKVIEFIRKQRPQRAPRRPGEAARRGEAPRLAGARAGGEGHPQAARRLTHEPRGPGPGARRPRPRRRSRRWRQLAHRADRRRAPSACADALRAMPSRR